MVYARLDVARRFGPTTRTGVRANVALRDGETAIDDQDRELTVLGLRPRPPRRAPALAADLGWQDHRIDAPRPSVTPSGGIAESARRRRQLRAALDLHRRGAVVRRRARASTTLNRATYRLGRVRLRNGEEHNVLANPTALPDGTHDRVPLRQRARGRRLLRRDRRAHRVRHRAGRASRGAVRVAVLDRVAQRLRILGFLRAVRRRPVRPGRRAATARELLHRRVARFAARHVRDRHAQLRARRHAVVRRRHCSC